MDNETPKIAMTSIYLEITRQCNLQCKHCRRGDPQNMSMSNNQIDRILDNFNWIDKVFIGGGEPFLAKDSISHLLSELKNKIEKGKFVCRCVGLITNGTQRDKEVITLLNEMGKYLSDKWYKEDTKTISIGISKDEFHDNNSENAMEWFKSECDERYISLHFNELDIDKRTKKPIIEECERAIKNNLQYSKRYGISELHRVELYKNTLFKFNKNDPNEEPKILYDGDCLAFTCTDLFLKGGFYGYAEIDKPDYPFILGNYMKESVFDMIINWNTLHPLLEQQAIIYENLVKRGMTQKDKEKHIIRFHEKEDEVRKQLSENKDNRDVWDIYKEVFHYDFAPEEIQEIKNFRKQ